MRPLHRNSLADQAVALLRQAIAEGRWKAEMPSEAELGRELQVSRVTLRRALAQLTREGWISSGGRGAHHRIRKRVAIQRGPSGHIVRVLSPYSLYSLGTVIHVALDTIAERLGAAGCRLEFEYRPAAFKRGGSRELEHLITLPDTAVWLLLYATGPMQSWFAARKVPCLVLGRPEAGVELAAVFGDTPTIGRHAAGLFYQRGHRELVYLIADFTSLNDRLASEAFAEEARRLGARARIITHQRERFAVSRALDLLFAERPRPTAYFSGCPEHCLTILCYLLNAGLRVPADASIISGWDDELLQFAIPSFDYYRVDCARMGRRAADVLMDLIRNGAGKLRTVPIQYTFVPGETLGPVREGTLQ